MMSKGLQQFLLSFSLLQTGTLGLGRALFSSSGRRLGIFLFDRFMSLWDFRLKRSSDCCLLNSIGFIPISNNYMELNYLGMMGSLSSIWKQLNLEQSFFLAKISSIELTIFPSILARGLMLILNSGLSATTYPTVDLLYRFCLLLWSYTSLCPLYSSYFRYFFAFAVGFYLGVSKVGDGQAYFNYFCYYYPFVFLLFSQAFCCFLNALSRFSACFLSSYSACQRQNVNKPTSQYQKPFIFLLTHQRQLSEPKLKYSNLAKVKPLQYIYPFLSIFGYLKRLTTYEETKKGRQASNWQVQKS